MFTEVAPMLTCPLCGQAMRFDGTSLCCGSRHSFDRARQGYVNLLAGNPPPGTADTPEMVEARVAFLAAGHYQPLAQRIARLSADAAPAGLVLDAGAGTGYYLDAVLRALPDATGLALDISKFALRRTARLERVAAAVWDIWRPLPIKSASAALILNVFAPRNGAEFHRVLHRDGALLVVTPMTQHLSELVRAFHMLAVDTRKEERLDEGLGAYFTLVQRETLRLPLALSRTEALALISMGPSAHHLNAKQLEIQVQALAEPISVTAAFTLSLYRPRHG